MSRYKLQWLPQGAIPQDLNLTLTLQDAAPDNSKQKKTAVITGCGQCTNLAVNFEGVDLTPATFYNLSMTDLGAGAVFSTLRVVPQGLDLGDVPETTIIGRSADWVAGTAQWIVQTSSLSYPTNLSLIGAHVTDGIQMTFDSSVDGGWAGANAFVLLYVPDRFLGNAPTFACGQINVFGPPPTMDISFSACSSDDVQQPQCNGYEAVFPVECAAVNNYSFTLDVIGAPSGSVIWHYSLGSTFDPSQWTFVEGATTLQVNGSGGPINPCVAPGDCITVWAEDSLDPSQVAPPGAPGTVVSIGCSMF